MPTYYANVSLAEGGRRYQKGDVVHVTEERAMELMATKDVNGQSLITDDLNQVTQDMANMMAAQDLDGSAKTDPSNQISYNQPQNTNIQDNISVALGDDEVEFATELGADAQLMEAQKLVDQYLSENPTASREEAEEAVGMNVVQGQPDSQASQWEAQVEQAQQNAGMGQDAEFAQELANVPQESTQTKASRSRKKSQ